ncbi:MAG: ROK family protein [Bdellovibrionales bacterium]
MKATIGFDLGGTKLAAALVDHQGKILEKVKLPIHLSRYTKPAQAQSHVIQMMVDIAVDFKRRYPKACSRTALQGIGLASAGPMDIEKRILVNPANFPGWRRVALPARLELALEKNGIRSRVHFQNDAMAAAFAEGWVGAARALQTYAVVTVGTGIGTGVILNRQPCQSRGAGPEFGHMLIDRDPLQFRQESLKHGSVEGLASGTALVRRAQALGFKGQSVEELVHGMKPRYHSLFEDMSWALAMLCFNLSIGFHLDAIFFSGGLIKIQELYFPRTVKIYNQLIQEFNPLFRARLSLAKTRNQAGLLGAAYLPWASQRPKNSRGPDFEARKN